ncbi:MAG: hypothetical protein IKP60_07210 [Treponema sp.]|nr:hypothetical protein [Treponema sp.]
MESVGDATGKATTGLNNFTMGFLTLNQGRELLSAVTSKFAELEAAIQQCVSVYQFQYEQETKLETIMRQRMDATEAEIQSIKDLASAQQQVGIYGDEMILKGAQELASFTSNKKAIETLIPAMNNLIAQQYGYNASAQSFQSTADMMGKVLSGQVGALSRLGYVFSEEEKQMLQTGNEMERAATLAKIITDNVGEMNETLAASDFGAMQNMANAVGDVQEKLGEALLPLQKMIEISSGEIKIFFMEKLTEFLNFVNSHPIVKALIGGAIVAALTAIGVIIVSSVIPALVGVAAQLGIIQAMSGPIGWISLAIGAIAGGVAAIINLIPDVGEGEDELAEKSRIWAENITEIQTDLETIKDIINTDDDQQMFRFDTESVDAYRYQLHEVADQIQDWLNYGQDLEGIDWRGMSLEELESTLRESNSLMDYEINQIKTLKMSYDDYQNKLDRTCAVIGTQNALLERQNRIQENINATNERGASIAQSLADAYAKTAAGKEAELRAELALWQKRKAEKYYTVAKAGNTSDQIFYDKVYYTKEELDQMDVVIASLQDSLKPKSYGSSVSSTPKHYTDWKDVFKSVTGVDVDSMVAPDVDYMHSQMQEGWLFDSKNNLYMDSKSGMYIIKSTMAVDEYIRSLDKAYESSDRLKGVLDSGWSKSAEDVLAQERDKLTQLVDALDKLFEGNEKIEVKEEEKLKKIEATKKAIEESRARIAAAESGGPGYASMDASALDAAMEVEKQKLSDLLAQLETQMYNAGYVTEGSNAVKKLRYEIEVQQGVVREAETAALDERYRKEMDILETEGQSLYLTEEQRVAQSYISQNYTETMAAALARKKIENDVNAVILSELDEMADGYAVMGLTGEALQRELYMRQGISEETATTLAHMKSEYEYAKKLSEAKTLQDRGNVMAERASQVYQQTGSLDVGGYAGGKMLSAVGGALQGTDVGNAIEGAKEGGPWGAIINVVLGAIMKVAKSFDNFDKVMNPVTEWMMKLAPLLRAIFDITEMLNDIVSALLDFLQPLMIAVSAVVKVIKNTLGQVIKWIQEGVQNMLKAMGLDQFMAIDEEKQKELDRLKELNKQYETLSNAIDEQNQYYLRQRERVNAQAYDSLLGTRSVNDLIVTKSGTFSTHPEDTIFAMKHPEDLARGGTSVNVKVINERGGDTDVNVERGGIDNEIVVRISRRIAGDYARGANGWDDADRMRQSRAAGRRVLA